LDLIYTANDGDEFLIDHINRLAERVPTFAFTLKGFILRQVAEKLRKRDFYVWDGILYAFSVTESLGLEESGGIVRVGLVHYNTVEEIVKFGEALGEIATGKDRCTKWVDFPNMVDSRGWAIVKIKDIFDQISIGYLPYLCPASSMAL
jgi:hypothetical protein